MSKTMIICFNCPKDTKLALDALIATEQYKDYGDVIRAAVANLAILQDELSERGSLVIDDQGGTGGRPRFANRDDRPWLTKRAPSSSAPELDDGRTPIDGQTPPLFALAGIQEAPSGIPSPADGDGFNGQVVSIEGWVFGQYNRLLPAKASTRAIAHLMSQEANGVNISDAADVVSHQACALGENLLRHDQKHRIDRDHRLATAFPSTGPDVSKSRSRFANQFIASANRKRERSGLLVALNLAEIDIRPDKTAVVCLNKAGWTFARLPNPVLEHQQADPRQKFSQDEREFLLGHIAAHVPAERAAYVAILTAMQSGKNTPEAVDLALRRTVDSQPGTGVSSSFLSSQRSGAISRMADLDLITRVRDSINVSYRTTRRGEEYLISIL